MKRSILFFVIIALLAGLSTACSKSSGNFKDGEYFAIDDEFAESGWKSFIIVKVADGKIADITWSAVSKNAGMDKVSASKAGYYPMVKVGKAQAEWHVQAQRVIDYVLKEQTVEPVEYKDNEGHTDAISGVSIHVSDFFTLLNSALDAGPQKRGPYKDGAYSAEEDAFSHGWKGTIDITVAFGKILSVNWNAVSEEDPEMDKKTASKEGKYKLAEGSIAPWYEQASRAEAHLISTQDPEDITYTDDKGHTDAISSVSIHVNDFYALANEALKDAK